MPLRCWAPTRVMSGRGQRGYRTVRFVRCGLSHDVPVHTCSHVLPWAVFGIPAERASPVRESCGALATRAFPDTGPKAHRTIIPVAGRAAVAICTESSGDITPVRRGGRPPPNLRGGGGSPSVATKPSSATRRRSGGGPLVHHEDGGGAERVAPPGDKRRPACPHRRHDHAPSSRRPWTVRPGPEPSAAGGVDRPVTRRRSPPPRERGAWDVNSLQGNPQDARHSCTTRRPGR